MDRPGVASAGRRGELFGGASGMSLAQLLLNAAPLPRGDGGAGPVALDIELPGVGGIGEAALEDVEDLRPQLRVLDRDDQLDAAVEVARHQVDGADQDPGLGAALEAVDARVLEEAADDRDDPYVLREARHPGPQAADPAHVEVDPHPRPRRLVQS